MSHIEKPFEGELFETDVFPTSKYNHRNSILLLVCIDDSTLLISSWVIRTTWQEIQRFVWKFKAKYTVHDSTFKDFRLHKPNK